MKFAIDAGHNISGVDTGAKGIIQEDDLTLDVAFDLIELLEGAGHEVVDCTPSDASSPSDSLRRRVKTANDAEADAFISIHFNAFNGSANGSEVFALSLDGKKIANAVLRNITRLGFRDRGVKEAAFYVLRHTTMPAILVECCFCDNQDDMNRLDVGDMARAIAKGLIGDKLPPKSSPEPRKLKVTTETHLKPNTSQVADIEDQEQVFPIEVGEYPILDSGWEEGHYWVLWEDESYGERRFHFVYEGHGEVLDASSGT